METKSPTFQIHIDYTEENIQEQKRTIDKQSNIVHLCQSPPPSFIIDSKNQKLATRIDLFLYTGKN